LKASVEPWKRPAPTGVLRLRLADTFMRRLLGVHAGGPLAQDEGLLLTSCRSVHTLFLLQPLDIVFLDGHAMECGQIDSLPPRRVAARRTACMVVELPAGYCRRHPDYLPRIHAALRLRETPRLPD